MQAGKALLHLHSRRFHTSPPLLRYSFSLPSISAVHCIRSDDEKCWAVVSEHHLQSLLHLAAVDYSPAIMASLHNYAALFAIFDTIGGAPHFQ